MEFHNVLGLCRPENKKRWLYREPLKKIGDKQIYEESLDLKCSKCAYQTKKGDQMALHLAPGQLCYGFKALILKNDDKNESKGGKNIYEEMVEIFGLKRLVNIDPVTLRRDDEKQEIFKENESVKKTKIDKRSKSCSPSLKNQKSKEKMEELAKMITLNKIPIALNNSLLISFLFPKQKHEITFKNDVEQLVIWYIF